MGMGRPRRRDVLAAAIGIAGLATSPTGRHPSPRIVAHRGCMDRFPENTARAARRSAPHVDAVEIDVRRCGTGDLVAFHDPTLGRLTTASGRVDETPIDRLTDLRVAGSTATVNRFETVVDAVPPSTDLLIDLKESGLAVAVSNVLSNTPNFSRVAAADTPLLTRYAAVDPDRDRILVSRTTSDALGRAAEFDCSGIMVPFVRLSGNPTLPLAGGTLGMAVGVWPIRSLPEVVVATGVGCQTLLVNRPDLDL